MLIVYSDSIAPHGHTSLVFTDLEREVVIFVRFSEDKSRTCVGIGEKFNHPVTEPLEGSVSSRPAENDKRQNKLETDSPQNSQPVHLQSTIQRLM